MTSSTFTFAASSRPCSLAVLILALCAGCSPHASAPPVVYRVPGMDAVAVKKDLVYKSRDSQPLKLNVYYPQQTAPKARHPAVILIHGGAMAAEGFKDTRAFTSWGRLMAASGLATVTFNRDHHNYSDVDDLIRYVRANAATLQIDKERLCLFAFSAGASQSVRAGLHGAPDYVRCVVAYYGDLRSVEAELSHEPVSKIPPILIAKAGKDNVVAGKEIDGFVALARAKGVNVTLLTHPEGFHAFDLRNDDDTSRRIIQETIAFIQKHLLSSQGH